MMWLHESRKKSREEGRKNKTEKTKGKKKEKIKKAVFSWTRGRISIALEQTDRTPEMLIEWAYPGLLYAVWLYFGSIYLMNTGFGAGIMIPAFYYIGLFSGYTLTEISAVPFLTTLLVSTKCCLICSQVSFICSTSC